MKIIRNKIPLASLQKLQKAIKSFVVESSSTFDTDSVFKATVHNICIGMYGQAAHDLWIVDDVKAYCLCRLEIDADGNKVYTAYQLWIDPKHRNGSIVYRLIKFLRFYAQKQGYKRLYVISSRLDNIKGYAKGLGKKFKPQSVIFVNEF